MEQMNELQLQWQERTNTGTTWTHNEEFDKNGYLVIKDLWSVDELYRPMPEERRCDTRKGDRLDTSGASGNAGHVSGAEAHHPAE